MVGTEKEFCKRRGCAPHILGKHQKREGERQTDREKEEWGEREKKRKKKS